MKRQRDPGQHDDRQRARTRVEVLRDRQRRAGEDEQVAAPLAPRALERRERDDGEQAVEHVLETLTAQVHVQDRRRGNEARDGPPNRPIVRAP